MAEVGAWVGIATGPLVADLAAEQGIGTEGYEWIYGTAPRAHPFEPHVELDGTFFLSFDELVNPESFPDTPFLFPGDHDGCICDYLPTLIETPVDTGQQFLDVTALLLDRLRAEAAEAERALDVPPRRKRKRKR